MSFAPGPPVTDSAVRLVLLGGRSPEVAGVDPGGRAVQQRVAGT